MVEDYGNDIFYYKNGEFFVENKRIDEIREEIKEKCFPCSPFFVYSKSQILSNVESYKKALESRKWKGTLNYAMKANPNMHILRIFRENGLGLTLVSGMELKLALLLDFDPATIVFNGNGKASWEIKMAIEAGVILNIDSLFNLEQTISVSKKLEKKARVILRVNPNIKTDIGVHKYNSTAVEGCKFGVDLNKVEDVVSLIKKSSGCIDLIGLHCHLGSTIEDVSIYRQSTKVLMELLKSLKSQGFPNIHYINLGGGLGIPYQQYANPCHNDLPTASAAVNAIDDLIDPDIEVILEPGRSLIGNACCLVTTVLGTKQSGHKNFMVVDGAMTEVIRPSLYNAYHHIDLTKHPSENEQCLLYDVVGPVCESGDFLGKDRLLHMPEPGDGAVVFDTGAYCSSMASNYNLRLRVSEVLVDNDSWKLIRRPDTFEDLIKPFIFS